MISPISIEEHSHHHIKKKRVGKACDSCRIKKTKCDGKKPCNRCLIDNKICIFTDKKKLQQKTYPPGYVELLETRIELLTKSLEKLIDLSKFNLPFLQELASQNSANQENADSPDEESANDRLIPINQVVLYLINNENLLKNLPVEWERGALIAASYNKRTNSSQSIKQFADHKISYEDYNEESKSPVLNNRADFKVKSEEDYNQPVNLAEDQIPIPIKPDSPPKLTETLNLNDFSLGGFSLGVLLANSIAGVNSVSSSEFTDFESDCNSNFGRMSMNGHSIKQEPLSPARSSLFLDTNSVNSADDIHELTSLVSFSSLTNKGARQIASPPEATQMMKSPESSSSIIRRASSSLTRPYSPSNKSKGYIHKPSVSSSHHTKHITITNPSSSPVLATSFPASLFNNNTRRNREISTYDETNFNDFTVLQDMNQEFTNEPTILSFSDYNGNSEYSSMSSGQPVDIIDGTSDFGNMLYTNNYR